MTILVLFAALIYLVLNIKTWGTKEKPVPWQQKVATVLAILGIVVWFVVAVIASSSLTVPKWLVS